MLEKFINAFSNLRTDKNRNRYPAFTNHRAPHKPFLLLSIMDLIAQGKITSNFIEPSFELAQTWNGYYSSVMPPGSITSMAYPFSRLKTDGFWERLPRPGYDPETEYNIKSMRRLQKIYYGAKMDDDLFRLLCEPATRERLRVVLVQKYFAPEVRMTLLDQGRVNYEAYEYAKMLMAEQEGEYRREKPGKEDREKSEKARDQGFRKAIISLYDHRCSLCGIRMLTPEGHTVVEAAHIKPWSESHDDRPTNGMALCRLCHWSFDEGLMSVGKKYEVLVSKRIQVERNLPGHILTLRDRTIFKPEKDILWPAQENFDWHRRRTFTT